MDGPGRFSKDTPVVRCGKPPFSGNPLHRSCGRHEGFFGFSVQAADLPIETLAKVCRNSYIGFTTVGAFRQMGYDVVATSGAGYHATVVVPEDWSEQAATALTALFAGVENPRIAGR